MFPDTGIGLQESPYSKQQQDYVKAEYLKADHYPSPPDHLQHLHHHPDMTSMAYPPVSSKGPYSVNGISLSSPNVDMMHHSMGYQSKSASHSAIMTNCKVPL